MVDRSVDRVGDLLRVPPYVMGYGSKLRKSQLLALVYIREGELKKAHIVEEELIVTCHLV